MTYFPSHLILQWHITDRCNLQCTHCYQSENPEKDPDFKALLEVLEQFKSLLNAPCAYGGKPVRGHITVTGGEPFIRDDFLDLLDVFSRNRNLFSFAVLTNGTLIDNETARCLKKLKPRFVQLSMDGGQETHDRIRGDGNFDQTIASLKRLVRAGVNTLISFTAHKDNFREFPLVARLGRRLGVKRVWADRLVPIGNSTEHKDQVLGPEETRDLFILMKKERLKAQFYLWRYTDIAMHRALQFLVHKSGPYHCTAGDTLLTVMPNGDLYPCRRMPIRIGNLFETQLSVLYSEDKILRGLRHQEKFDPTCEKCRYKNDCRGGLKCLSYALNGDPFRADPGCWINNRP